MNLLPNIDVAESDQEIDVSVEMPGLERVTSKFLSKTTC